MKLLTLNTHSHIEENYEEKLGYFVAAVQAEKPDVIALQEVNQSSDADYAVSVSGLTPCCKDIIRSDNHVCRAAEMLAEAGEKYFWTWLPIKRGYEKFDEGIALMSRSPILETDVLLVSAEDNYSDWKTRKIVGIRTERYPGDWFFSVHFGWWNDPDEPFRKQWIRTAEHMTKYDSVWLMGDFNAPPEIRGEGYELVSKSYVYDTYLLAAEKHGRATARGDIDGWRERKSPSDCIRTDQIWCSRKNVILSSEVVFDGGRYPVVSDHFGVLISCEKSIV